MSVRPHQPVQLLGLTARAAIATAIIVTIVVAAVLSVVASTAARAASETAQRNLDRSADLVAQLLSGRENALIGGARVFVQYSPFRATISGGRREDVLDQAVGAVDQIGADWVFITNGDGVLVAKSDEPTVAGVSMGQYPLVAGALSGLEQRGFGASGDTMLFQAVAVPIKVDIGAPAGALVATQVVDSAFLETLRTVTSSDLLFYTRDEQGREHPAASTVPGSVRDLSNLLANRTSSTNNSSQAFMLGNVRYRWIGTSLFTAGGQVVGGFLVMRAEDNASTGIAALRKPVTVAFIVGLIAVLFAAVLTSRYVVRPMRLLTADIDGVADAANAQNAHASQPFAALEDARASGIQEVHELAEAFQSLRSDLRDRDALVSVARVSMPKPDDDVAAMPERIARGSRSALRTTGSAAIVSRQITRPGLVLEDGAVFANRYVIQAEVGRGGLGIVYRALDRVLSEVVAVKVLRPELAPADGAGFERLKGDLRVTRALSHRNIVRTHDIGETDEAPFLTMEYVDGISLAAVIASRGALPREATLATAKQMLAALSAAHEQQIVHGDLKPQNLLVDANGLIRITDFGIARLMRHARQTGARGSTGSAASDTGRLSGAVIGTPEYMAPEQLIGEASSVRSDLYAAGVVLRECLTGTTPYQSATPVEFVARKLGQEGEQPNESYEMASRTRDPGISEIVSIIDALTSARVELRPQSAREVYLRFAQLG